MSGTITLTPQEVELLLLGLALLVGECPPDTRPDEAFALEARLKALWVVADAGS